MKRLLMLIPLAFLCCLAVGCISRDYVAPTDVEADIQAIKDIVEEYEAAVNTSDVDRIMKAYADDAVEIRPNEPAFIGKEAIRGRKKQIFEEVAIQDDYVVKDVEVSADLAVAHLIYTAIITTKAGGERFNYKGNWIWVLKKQSDYSWKLIYSIWSDEN